MEFQYDQGTHTVLAYDHQREVGRLTVSASPKIWIIDFLGVKEAYLGQGLDEDLVAYLLAKARLAKVKVTAT